MGNPAVETGTWWNWVTCFPFGPESGLPGADAR
jgi:hypothetical protein